MNTLSMKLFIENPYGIFEVDKDRKKVATTALNEVKGRSICSPISIGFSFGANYSRSIRWLESRVFVPPAIR